MIPPVGADIHCPMSGCGGLAWDNRTQKASGARHARSPDFRCKECHAVGWDNHDGMWTWKPESTNYSKRI